MSDDGGQTPEDFVLAARSTTAEGVTLSGCGQSGDIPSYLDLVISVPVSAELPATIDHVQAPDATSGAPGVRGSIIRCDQGACGSEARRLFFGAPGIRNTQVDGVVEAFDPVAGGLRMTASVRAMDSGTKANLDLDITWNSPYERTVTVPLSGRWIVEAAEGTELEPLGLELSQEGAVFTGQLCDDDFETCGAATVTGELSDPWLRLRWSLASDTATSKFSLTASMKDGGESFEGTLGESGGSLVNVLGRRPGVP